MRGPRLSELWWCRFKYFGLKNGGRVRICNIITSLQDVAFQKFEAAFFIHYISTGLNLLPLNDYFINFFYLFYFVTFVLDRIIITAELGYNVVSLQAGVL